MERAIECGMECGTGVDDVNEKIAMLTVLVD